MNMQKRKEQELKKTEHSNELEELKLLFRGGPSGN